MFECVNEFVCIVVCVHLRNALIIRQLCMSSIMRACLYSCVCVCVNECVCDYRS